MTWSVAVSEEASQFLANLTSEEREEVLARIKLLRQLGPNLPRPYSGTLRDSKHKNMKELRIPYERKQFRVLYAFDTEQNAILLVGGDKVPLGEKRWYPKFIEMADRIYDEHEAQLDSKRKAESKKPKGTPQKSSGKKGRKEK